MPSNANIILQQNPGVDANELINNYLIGRKLKAQDAESERENKLAQLYAGTSKENLPETLMKGGFYKESQDYSKNQADLLKAEADRQKVEAETQIKQFERKKNMLDASLQLANGYVQDPYLTKEKIVQGNIGLAKAGIIDENILNHSLEQINNLPEDTLSLRQWAKQSQAQLMSANEAMKYQQPDANAILSAETSRQNAQLSAETSRQNAQLSAETQRGGQAMNYDLGMGKLYADVNKPKSQEKPPTDTQLTTNIFATRADEANKILNDLEGKYSAFGISAKKSLEEIPGGSMIANAALSEESQRAEQAQRDFINAILRKESGAVISKEEFDNAAKQYFPQPNDRDPVKQQKAANRALALEGLKKAAGRAYSGNTGGASGSWQKPDDWEQFLKETGGG